MKLSGMNLHICNVQALVSCAMVTIRSEDAIAGNKDFAFAAVVYSAQLLMISRASTILGGHEVQKQLWLSI